MPYITLLSITTINAFPARLLVLFSPIIMNPQPLIPLHQVLKEGRERKKMRAEMQRVQ